MVFALNYDLAQATAFVKVELGAPVLRNPNFLKFINLLAQLNKSGRIPQKECRACGKVYCDLDQYIWDTEAKAQTMEDAGGVMSKAFTMLYRNCSCGNTLVLTLTGEIFPEISEFWNMIRSEAQVSGLPVRDVVLSFMNDWEDRINRNHAGSKKTKRKS